MPAWVISLISAVIGAVASVAVQFLSLRLGDRYKRHKMRMVLYGELSAAAMMLEAVLNHSEQKLKIRHVVVDDKVLLSPLVGRKYIEANLDIFVQLHEHITISSLYRQVEIIITNQHSANDDIRRFLQLLDEFINNKALERKYMRWYLAGS